MLKDDGASPFFFRIQTNTQITEPWWLSGLMCQSIATSNAQGRGFETWRFRKLHIEKYFRLWKPHV